MPDGDANPRQSSAGERHLFLLAGHLSLAVGVVGLLVPVMPTSPFVIIAAACYARSSDRFYRMLLNNRWFGADVRRWLEHRCVHRRLRMLSTVSLTVAFALTVWLFITPLWAKLAVGALGVAAIIAVLMLPVCDQVE